MRTTPLFFISILCLLTGFSQDSTEWETRKLNNFNELIVTGNFSTTIVYSDENKVEIQLYNDEVELEKLEFIYSNDELEIKYKGSFVDKIGIHLKMYYNGNIKLIESNRGAEIKVRGASFFNDEAEFTCDSGGKILVEELQLNEVEASISKGGSINISGKTKSFDAKIAAGGTLDASNLIADEVEAKVTFGGEITCFPQNELDAKVSSGGTINYKGDPDKVSQKTTLGGSINKL